MSEEKSFFEKNMEMWERWTNSYMDTMEPAFALSTINRLMSS